MSLTATATSVELQPIEAGKADYDSPAITTAENQLPADRASSSLEASAERVLSNTGKVELPRVRAVAVISTLTGMTFLNTMGTGILTVGLPSIAKDLELGQGILLWPASIYALTAGCVLLLAGSIADVVGSRITFLVGCFFSSMFTLACGLSRTGVQLIAFRALLGVAMALVLPSAVSIISHNFAAGHRRNIAFACMGGGQPLGFSLGLIIGGVFIDSIGWRWGYYISAAICLVLFAGAFWGLPTQHHGLGQQQQQRQTLALTPWQRLWNDIDWVGAVLIGASLGMMSYVLAVVTASYRNLSDASNIAILSVAIALLPAFVLWVGRQERLGKPAVIPNSLWSNVPFTCICISVFFCWAATNSLQYFSTLFFQEVQGVSVIQTSVRFMPMVISGVLANVVAGVCVNRVSARVLVAAGAIITVVAPVLMAAADPHAIYWRSVFPAILLAPISADVMFTVSNLVITKAFPANTQALAGGVFNTVAQFGNSVGLAVTAAIASSVTAHETPDAAVPRDSPEALLLGYRAVFWTIFAAMLTTCFVSVFGLRRVGIIGLKND